ncbi:MAG: HAD family hydrolase [Clostridia bacterium]|nr:HAD family hydrolase [Clostridia bacterium]
MNFVFDLYGTLIDIWTDESREELWEGIALLLGDGEENGDKVKEEYLTLCREMHRGGYHELNLLCVFEKMLESRDVDISVAPSLASEFRRMSMERLACFDGVEDMLRELKRNGAGVYLLSNAQSCFTVDELKSTGLYDLFDGIVISSDIGVKKPCVDAFAAAFQKFGINAENSMYIGNDLRDDILGAANAGMRSLYIHTEQSGIYPELDLPDPTYTVKNHSEMKSLLLSLI